MQNNYWQMADSNLYFEKCRPDSVLPERKTRGAAGYDLYADEDILITPGETVRVSVGTKMKLPSGTYGKIMERSSLAYRLGLSVGGGVIDEDYRGEVFVILRNNGVRTITIQKRQRIAQLVLMPYYSPQPIHVYSLPQSERGENGFGSTGK